MLAACAVVGAARAASDASPSWPEPPTAAPGPDTAPPDAPPPYSAPAHDVIPRQLLWGDTHLHTRLSQDAFSFGVTLGADDAYRFAKGGTLTATHGQRARLDRPLDFLVIADHAHGLGAMSALVDGNEKLVANPRLVEWRRLLLEVGGPRAGLRISEDGRLQGWPAELNDPEILAPAWREVVEAAERHDAPGHFTAFIGYEWTSWPGGNNLHRVVVFRDGADRLIDRLPFSAWMSDDPEDLGAYGRFRRRESADRRDRDAEGDRAPHINLVGDEYHVFLEGVDLRDGGRRIGRLGALPDSIVDQYAATGADRGWNEHTDRST